MQTHLVRSKLYAHFGGVHAPASTELVKDDGCDLLEKESALRFFPGKSWENILHYLRSIANHPTLGASYMLEEWSVLEPRAINYYARAYLEHLLDTVESDDPDESYIATFFHELYQVVYSARHESMSTAQLEIFRCAAHCIATRLWAPSVDLEYAPESARRFLAELNDNR